MKLWVRLGLLALAEIAWIAFVVSGDVIVQGYADAWCPIGLGGNGDPRSDDFLCTFRPNLIYLIVLAVGFLVIIEFAVVIGLRAWRFRRAKTTLAVAGVPGSGGLYRVGAATAVLIPIAVVGYLTVWLILLNIR